MTLDEQRSLAASLNGHIQMLRYGCIEGPSLFNSLSDHLPDLKALIDAAGPSGMDTLACQFPHLGHFAELLAGRARGVPSSVFIPPKPGSDQSQRSTRWAAPLSFRLQRAAAILAHTNDPDAADAQSACREVASRIIHLEEVLSGLLAGKKGAAERAKQALALEWS